MSKNSYIWNRTSKKDAAEVKCNFMKKGGWNRTDLRDHVSSALEKEGDEVLIRILLTLGYIALE